jgi:hypothetical protein
MSKPIAALIAALFALAVLHPAALVALFVLALVAVIGVWGLLIVKVVGEGRRYSYSRRVHL